MEHLAGASVLVVPVYIEVPNVARAVMALESHLERAGYVFHVGDPIAETLEQAKQRITGTNAVGCRNNGAVGARVSA